LEEKKTQASFCFVKAVTTAVQVGILNSCHDSCVQLPAVKIKTSCCILGRLC